MATIGYTNTNRDVPGDGKNLESRKAKTVIKNLIVRPAKIDTADIGTWKTAVNKFKQGNRQPLYDLLENLMADPVMADAVDKLTGAVTNAEIMFQKDGQSVEDIDDLIDTPEFERMLEEIALKFAWGKSVFETSFSPQFSIFPFPRKNVRITNLDKPLSQRKKFIAEKPTDQDGYDYTKDPFIIECGDDDDMGFLFRAAQYVIYKRGGFGDWAQFVEIFGMPFIIGKYEGFDESTRDLLFQALEMVGGNTRMAAPKGSEIDVVPNGSSGSADLYEKFRRACNEEILIAILGNTMTTLEGSSRAQSQTHMETQEQRFKRVRRYTQRILNRYFLPLLIQRGYDVGGGFFSFPDAGETISTKERVDMALTMRDKGLPVDEDYIFEISGVAKSQSKKDEKQEDPPEEQKEEQPEAKNGNNRGDRNLSENRLFILKWLDKVFPFAPTKWSGAGRSLRRILTGNTGSIVNLDDKYDIDIDKLLRDAINSVYGNRYGEQEQVDKSLFKITNDALQQGIDTALEDNTPDPGFIRQFKNNAAVFAAFKNYQQTREFVAALYDQDGKLRSFREFRKACLQIGEKFNEQYLQTEYNTAVHAARMAANLKQFEKDADLYPNLEYLDSIAAHPRKSHAHYVGTVLPIGHPAWSWLMPPSDWNCQCSVRPSRKDPTAVPGKPDDLDPVFDNNPADTGRFVNIKETAYYKHTPAGDRAKVLAEVEKLRLQTEDRPEVTGRYNGKKGGYLDIVKQQGQERNKNLATYKIMADNGGQYTLLQTNAGGKNPDAFNFRTGLFSDAKHPVTDNGKSAIQTSVKKASGQNVGEVIIRLDKDYSNRSIWEGFRVAFQPGRAKSIETVIMIKKGKTPVIFNVSDIRSYFGKK